MKTFYILAFLCLSLASLTSAQNGLFISVSEIVPNSCTGKPDGALHIRMLDGTPVGENGYYWTLAKVISGVDTIHIFSDSLVYANVLRFNDLSDGEYTIFVRDGVGAMGSATRTLFPTKHIKLTVSPPLGNLNDPYPLRATIYDGNNTGLNWDFTWQNLVGDTLITEGIGGTSLLTNTDYGTYTVFATNEALPGCVAQAEHIIQDYSIRIKFLDRKDASCSFDYDAFAEFRVLNGEPFADGEYEVRLLNSTSSPPIERYTPRTTNQVGHIFGISANLYEFLVTDARGHSRIFYHQPLHEKDVAIEHIEQRSATDESSMDGVISLKAKPIIDTTDFGNWTFRWLNDDFQSIPSIDSANVSRLDNLSSGEYLISFRDGDPRRCSNFVSVAIDK